MTAGALHLHTLGTWHLSDASGARRLEPGKPLALLTYLALTPRHRAGREHLIDLLWSESEPTRARQALRQTVWNLRQTIGADALSSDGDDLCLTGSSGSDWQTFLRHVERGEIEQAVAAYGGPFLPDFAAPGGAAFEQWADVERNRLHAAYVRALEALVRRELAAARVRDADALARRLRDTDPERESAWRLLLEVLLSAGDRSGAALEADALEARLRADGRDPEQAPRAPWSRAPGPRTAPRPPISVPCTPISWGASRISPPSRAPPRSPEAPPRRWWRSIRRSPPATPRPARPPRRRRTRPASAGGPSRSWSRRSPTSSPSPCWWTTCTGRTPRRRRRWGRW